MIFLGSRSYPFMAVTALVLLSGCGGGGGTTSTPAPPAAPEPAPTPTTDPTPTPTPTPALTPATVFDTAEYRRSDGPSFHNAIPAWQLGATGQGVTIGIVDTGIDIDSPEFAGRISSASTDVAGNRGIDAEDDHGTHVAMIAAADRDNTGIMGIAWQSTIMALRADAPGSCATEDANDPNSGCKFSDSAIAKGVDHATQNGATVINLSLGGSVPSVWLIAAIERATAAGVVIIVSAGNDGNPNPDAFATIIRSAGNGNVVIAGSVNEQGTVSSFSNLGGSEANWYLGALGERVCCVYEDGTMKVSTDSSGRKVVELLSGTSFSAPQIAGAATLLRQAFPNLTAAQVVDLLLRTARDAGAAGTDTTYGRGILDIANAFAPQGTTSLAGSTSHISLTDSTGTTSPAMGDAVHSATLSAIMLDGYSRAYRIDLGGTLRTAQVSPRLEGALSQQTRFISGGNDQLAIAFSIDGRGHPALQPLAGQLQLTRDDTEVARVLAARVIAQISPNARFGFAYAQGSDGLVAQLNGRQRPAFLVAGAPLDDLGFGRSGEAAFALHRRFGSWGITLSAEHSDAMNSAPDAFTYRSSSRRNHGSVTRFGAQFDRRFRAIDLALGASWLGEQRSVLGARFHQALGVGGADSIFLDFEGAWRPANSWRLGAAWRQGHTRVRGAGLLESGSSMVSSGWSLDVVRTGVFAVNDSLAFRVSQPLRVQSGGLNLDLPIAYSYDTLTVTRGIKRLRLVPRGREVTGELAWRGALLGGAGSASLFYRKDPGHREYLQDEKGLAVTWSKQF